MRKYLTLLLLAILLTVCGVTAWQWWRAYDSTADRAVPFRIQEVSVQRDHSYAWINLQLDDAQQRGTVEAPPMKLTATGMEPLEAADYRYNAKDHRILIRFWIEQKYLSQELQLNFREGSLLVKKAYELTLQDQETRTFRHTQW